MQAAPEEITNDALFSLGSGAQAQLPASLCDFLLTHARPWEALGKTLAEYLAALVDGIPRNQRMLGNISHQAWIDAEGGVLIEQGAVVEAGAFITGPTVLLAGSTVRHGAYVRGAVIACAGAVIGHTTEAKGSILLPGAKAAHFAYVGDSILGVDANLGAGTKLANLRFDHGEVKVALGGGSSPIKTGLKKFGAVLGNGAQTGCNSVTNPGTILLPGAMLVPCANAGGVIRGVCRGTTRKQ